MTRLGTITTSLLTALLVVWFSEAFRQLVPSPQRLLLRVENALSPAPTRSDDRFRIVLCWLENDWSGENTRTVEDAFSGVAGITLVVSDAVISASGAADEWRPAMQHEALVELEEWNADVAIIGSVKKSGEELALWFVPRQGDGTLRRADRGYTLEGATLSADFHEDLRTQLTVMAWNTVAPFTSAQTRGRPLREELPIAAQKLSALLTTPTINRPEHRAALYEILGDALSLLGKRESDTANLVQAIEAYRTALTIFTRQHAPFVWARLQNSLGLTLKDLADRKAGSEHLEQAVTAFQAALEVFSQQHTPFRWAAVQGNLGIALRRLAEREPSTARLEQAIAAHRAALTVFTRERAPDDWAFEQDNLGNALSLLGERENSTDLLEQALGSHRASLTVLTRARVPLSWATTQHNLGITLMVLGQRNSGTVMLEQSVDAFRAALLERTREHTPFHWAVTQNALGKTLLHLGERKRSRTVLEEAQHAFQAALEELGSVEAPRHRKMAQNNLEEVSRKLQLLDLNPSAAQ